METCPVPFINGGRLIYKLMLYKCTRKNTIRDVRKCTFEHVRPVNIQINLRVLDSQGCKVSSCAQRRLKSVCADAQADLSRRWAHMSEGTFSHVVTHISLSLHVPIFVQIL